MELVHLQTSIEVDVVPLEECMHGISVILNRHVFSDFNLFDVLELGHQLLPDALRVAEHPAAVGLIDTSNEGIDVELSVTAPDVVHPLVNQWSGSLLEGVLQEFLASAVGGIFIKVACFAPLGGNPASDLHAAEHALFNAGAVRKLNQAISVGSADEVALADEATLDLNTREEGLGTLHLLVGVEESSQSQ